VFLLRHISANRAHSLDDVILLADLAIWLANLIKDLNLLLGSFSSSGAFFLEPNFGVNKGFRMALLEEVQGHIYRRQCQTRPSNQTYLEQWHRFDL
jgi:hypothetical protein